MVPLSSPRCHNASHLFHAEPSQQYRPQQKVLRLFFWEGHNFFLDPQLLLFIQGFFLHPPMIVEFRRHFWVSPFSCGRRQKWVFTETDHMTECALFVRIKASLEIMMFVSVSVRQTALSVISLGFAKILRGNYVRECIKSTFLKCLRISI